jgi:hypothetical protein
VELNKVAVKLGFRPQPHPAAWAQVSHVEKKGELFAVFVKKNDRLNLEKTKNEPRSQVREFKAGMADKPKLRPNFSFTKVNIGVVFPLTWQTFLDRWFQGESGFSQICSLALDANFEFATKFRESENHVLGLCASAARGVGARTNRRFNAQPLSKQEESDCQRGAARLVGGGAAWVACPGAWATQVGGPTGGALGVAMLKISNAGWVAFPCAIDLFLQEVVLATRPGAQFEKVSREIWWKLFGKVFFYKSETFFFRKVSLFRNETFSKSIFGKKKVPIGFGGPKSSKMDFEKLQIGFCKNGENCAIFKTTVKTFGKLEIRFFWSNFGAALSPFRVWGSVGTFFFLISAQSGTFLKLFFCGFNFFEKKKFHTPKMKLFRNSSKKFREPEKGNFFENVRKSFAHMIMVSETFLGLFS